LQQDIPSPLVISIKREIDTVIISLPLVQSLNSAWKRARCVYARALKIRFQHALPYRTIEYVPFTFEIIIRFGRIAGKNTRAYNMRVHGRSFFFSPSSFGCRSDFSFYYLLMADIRLTRTSVSSRNRTCDSPGRYRIPVGVISRRRVRSIFGG